MGMCAYDGGHFACQIEAHGFLFRGGFRMEIHKDIGGVDILKEPVYTLEWVVQRLHERCAHKVYDCKAVRTHIKHAYAVACHAVGIICGAQQIFLDVVILSELLAPEAMVSCGDNVRKAEYLLHGTLGDAVSVGGIFAVYYNYVYFLLALEPPYGVLGKIAAHAAYYVSCK